MLFKMATKQNHYFKLEQSCVINIFDSSDEQIMLKIKSIWDVSGKQFSVKNTYKWVKHVFFPYGPESRAVHRVDKYRYSV